MKYALAVFCMLFFVQANSIKQPGNPKYNFPDSIIARFSHPDRSGGLINALTVSGYYNEAKMYEAILSPDNRILHMDLSQLELKKATPVILEEARHYNVVMFNESHIRPEHRLFVKSFLKELYKQGYRVLMVEGLQQQNRLDSNKCPVSKDGPFISEPNYAQLLRYALKMGYTVKAYEYFASATWDDSIKLDKYGSTKYIGYNPPDSMTKIYDEHGELKETIYSNSREEGQANNAYKVVRDNLPNKVVMMVGEGHINENYGSLGALLKKLLHEDILTIEQTLLSDRVLITDTLSKDTLRVREPSFIRNKRTNKMYETTNPYGKVDYVLLNATNKDSLGRPGYLYKDIEPRKTYFLPKKLLLNTPYVFAAYYTDEWTKFGDEAVAVDVLHIKDAKQKTPLLLYPAAYTIVKKTTKGTFETYKVSIK